MVSPTTSLGSPFSAESCARPVTSSRFIAGAPPLLQLAIGPRLAETKPTACPSRKHQPGPSLATKKVGSTHFQRRPRLPGIDRKPLKKLYQKGATGRLAAARIST